MTRDGDQVASLSAGDCFGELALLHDAHRNATVTAAEPLETIVVNSQEFRALLREAPELTHKVLSVS